MKNLYIPVVLAVLSVISSSYTYSNKPNPAATLVFPVAGTKSNVGSVWGDERDGGQRRHEGIDIFAAKGTPVVAVSDGVVIDVSEDGIGGKTVTMQSDDHPWRAYYAHLDQQKVHRGQVVSKGQILGTVGNTGNAKTTPAHLHFGIYTEDGAVDPLPVVKNAPKIAKPVTPDPVVQTRRVEPTVAKAAKKNRTVSPVIRNAAAGILTGILTKKIRGIFNR